MKYLISLMFLIIFSLSTIYTESALAADPITGSTVAVLTPQNAIYQLTLTSNPTTGYRWFLQSYDPAILTLLSHEYIAPNNNLMGAPGKETWMFRANKISFKAPSASEIHLIYARPWDIGHGTTQVFYIVTVPEKY